MGTKKDSTVYDVAIYCRLSKEDLKEDGDRDESASIGTQKAILTDYVRQRGWHLVQTYVDDGYSGTNFQRPGFQSMIQDIEAKRINCVITKDLSRLGRNYLDCGLYLEVFFPEHGVRYISVNDGVDTLNKSAMDITPFRNILNEMYAADVSMKVKSALRARFNSGLYVSTSPPYGYLKDPADHNHLIIDEKAAPVVNMNQKVRMYKYVTKGTFDAYNWGLMENKQKFIGQVMTSKSPARSAEDVDATALSYAEVKALATGDDRIREKMDLDVQVAKLKMLKANHTAMQYEMQDKALKYYPQKMAETRLFIEALGKDLPIVQAHPVKEDAFTMTVMGQVFTERKAAGEAIIKACMLMSDPEKPFDLGEYRGFPMQLHCDGSKFKVTMKQHLTYTAELSDDPVGNVTRINNALEAMAENLERNKTRLTRLESELKNAQEEAARPFPKEEELRTKSARLTQLNRELEKPSNKGAGQHQNGDDRPGAEVGEAPVREPQALAVMDGGKPSIRQALRDFNTPAPVHSGMEQGHRREAAR